MTFELLSMAELIASAAVVISGTSLLFGHGWRERGLIAGVLTIWLTSVLWAGATAALSYNSLGVLGLGLAVLLPILVLAGIGFGTAWGRMRIRQASLRGTIAIHAVRVLGVSFVLLHAAGRLPAPFAPVAGWGDVVIGATALPLAWLAFRPVRSGGLFAWSVLGLADLVAAVALGATSSPGPIRLFWDEPGSAIMTTLPWIVIPCFLVPILSFVHLVTLSRLLRAVPDTGSRETHAPSRSPARETLGHGWRSP